MMRAIVDHVAALAKALEITLPVIARIVVEVRCSEDDVGLSHLRRLLKVGPPGRPAMTIAPSVTSGIEPASIRQTTRSDAMRSAASLADAGGTLEAHAPTDLRPVAGIKTPHLRSDRHRHTRLR
jgi:hypothetical protein